MKSDAAQTLQRLARKCDSTARILKALAHPHRLQFLCHLASGEKTVGDLEKLSGASQSAASQFLGRMKSEGLVASKKKGQFVFYRIFDHRILEIIRALQKIFCS